MTRIETPRRSDRWAPSAEAGGNPWAIASVVFAALGLLAGGAIVAGTAGAPFLDSLPDVAASALIGSAPGFGLLALLAGLAGRTRPRLAWLAWTGAVVGSLLVVAAALVLLILLNSSRSLG